MIKKFSILLLMITFVASLHSYPLKKNQMKGSYIHPPYCFTNLFLMSYSSCSLSTLMSAPANGIYENSSGVSLKEAAIIIDEDDTEYDEDGFPIYQETPVRRAEIVFIISFPLVIMAHVLVIGVLNMTTEGNTLLKLGNEEIIFASLSSLTVSAAITYWDYRTVYHSPQKTGSRTGERVRYLRANYRF